MREKCIKLLPVATSLCRTLQEREYISFNTLNLQIMFFWLCVSNFDCFFKTTIKLHTIYGLAQFLPNVLKRDLWEGLPYCLSRPIACCWYRRTPGDVLCSERGYGVLGGSTVQQLFPGQVWPKQVDMLWVV